MNQMPRADARGIFIMELVCPLVFCLFCRTSTTTQPNSFEAKEGSSKLNEAIKKPPNIFDGF